jgi:hypothetical protein
MPCPYCNMSDELSRPSIRKLRRNPGKVVGSDPGRAFEGKSWRSPPLGEFTLSLTSKPWFKLPNGGRIMRYELTDGEWSAIKPMLPNKGAACPLT